MNTGSRIDFSQDEVLRTIYPHIKGKDVLDIGCIEHTLDVKHKERIWVHDFLREHASHVTGIDIQQKDIETLRGQGYDVSCQNAESFHFEKKFEVIFAGELIEHLSNPGLFLENCQRHLAENGRFIVTTPNAFSITRFLHILKGCTNDPVVNNEHAYWFSPTVLRQLFVRYGLNIEHVQYAHYPQISPRFEHRVISLLCSLFGKKFKEVLIVTATTNH